MTGTGTVYAWGRDNDGQLGNNQTSTQATPVQTHVQAGMTTISAGALHSIAISTTRTLSTAYTYDSTYRLLSGGTPGFPTVYKYDPVGNRITSTVGLPAILGGSATSYSYDKADRIQFVGAITYTVDLNGNLTGIATSPNPTSYVYDRANRLKTATVAGTTTSYVYDGDGKRISKTVGANPTVGYAYDVNGSLPVVLTDGALDYVYGLGLAYTVSTNITHTLQVLHTDGLGSVRAITDSGGNLLQTFQTDEFGVPAMTQGTNSEPFRYTGQQLDPETSLYDLRARYYAPAIGRFLSRDPLVGSPDRPLTLNRYTYTENNPTTTEDPGGLFPWIIDLGNLAHTIIQQKYLAAHPGSQAEVPYNVGGDRGRIDLVDPTSPGGGTASFWEIKPSSPFSFLSGQEQINRREKAGANQEFVRTHGYDLTPGTGYSGLVEFVPVVQAFLVAWQAQSGLILYSWLSLWPMGSRALCEGSDSAEEAGAEGVPTAPAIPWSTFLK